MWGAAPRSRRLIVVVVAAVAVASSFAASADARVNAGSSQRADIWGFEVTAESLSLLDARTAQRARAAGLNTLLLNPSLTAKQRARATKIARRHHFGVVKLANARRPSARPECKAWGPCVLATNDVTTVASLAEASDVDAVVVRVTKPACGSVAEQPRHVRPEDHCAGSAPREAAEDRLASPHLASARGERVRSGRRTGWSVSPTRIRPVRRLPRRVRRLVTRHSAATRARRRDIELSDALRWDAIEGQPRRRRLQHLSR